VPAAYYLLPYILLLDANLAQIELIAAAVAIAMVRVSCSFKSTTVDFIILCIELSLDGYFSNALLSAFNTQQSCPEAKAM
jgi:hypothetical protein